MTTERDWTRGYRDAWWYFRSGLAWSFLKWALDVMPADDPCRLQIALALRPLADLAKKDRPRP